MTTHYPIVFETEEDGAVSAYVAGLPVYAQADTEAEAERAIQSMLGHYFLAHPPATKAPWIKVARVETKAYFTKNRFMKEADLRRRATSVEITSAAAIVGAQTSRKKAAAARANGLLGGRPRLAKR